MKLEFSGQIFEEYSDTELHEILSSGSRVVPCGRTDIQPNITKLIVTYINFANAPEKVANCFGSRPRDSSAELGHRRTKLLALGFRDPVVTTHVRKMRLCV